MFFQSIIDSKGWAQDKGGKLKNHDSLHQDGTHMREKVAHLVLSVLTMCNRCHLQIDETIIAVLLGDWDGTARYSSWTISD